MQHVWEMPGYLLVLLMTIFAVARWCMYKWDIFNSWMPSLSSCQLCVAVFLFYFVIGNWLVARRVHRNTAVCVRWCMQYCKFWDAIEKINGSVYIICSIVSSTILISISDLFKGQTQSYIAAQWLLSTVCQNSSSITWS